MSDTLIKSYDRLVLRRPFLSLLIMALLVLGFASQTGKIKIDASADSLLLQGDKSLDLFREVSREYSSEEFLLITWQPQTALLAPRSVDPLKRMADELRKLRGVSSVVTVWDIPLLESPPVSLSDITSGDPLPGLDTLGIDRDLVLKELTTSPIYANLLASTDGTMTAVQINLERDEQYNLLLYQREDLRKLERDFGLTHEEKAELGRIEAEFKAHTAASLELQNTLVTNVRAIAANYSIYAKTFVGGMPMIASDMVSFVRSDLVLFGSAILGVMLVVLAVIFRRLRWVVIPLTTCVATVTVMLGLLGALDWRMTVISSNFVAVLLIVSLALSIHLVVRYRELHAASPKGHRRERVLDTVRLMAVPCFYTAVTTIVAFVSLIVSGIQPVIDFGLMMTVGIVIAVIMAFVIVPCLMMVWPRGRPVHHEDDEQPLTLKFARITDEHGKSILLVSAALLLVTVYGISRLQVENRFIDYFNDSTEIYQGMELLDAKLGGTIPLEIILSAPDFDEPLPGVGPAGGLVSTSPIDDDDPFAEESEDFAAAPADEDTLGDDDWGDDFDGGFDDFSSNNDAGFKPSYWFSLQGMREVDSLHNYLDSLPETGKVLSLSTIFSVVKNLMGDDIGGVELALVQKSLPPDIKGMMVDPYFSKNNEEARITVRVKETSKDLRRDEFLRDVHSHLIDNLGFEPSRVQFTGMLVLYNNVLQSLFKSQILTLGAVFLAILVMFLVLFRSMWLALIALAPNLLAAGMVLGVMGLAGIPLDIMTITIAAIVLGIGVDNCIHYVHRYMKEFPKDRNYRQTMYRCHGSIGRALYYTTVTVVVGFSMLTLSNFNPSIYFGLLTVLAMTAAVIGALLLLPRLIMLFKPLGPERE
ncbi:MAG: MMPL family transporter [Halioglobus sp.]